MGKDGGQSVGRTVTRSIAWFRPEELLLTAAIAVTGGLLLLYGLPLFHGIEPVQHLVIAGSLIIVICLGMNLLGEHRTISFDRARLKRELPGSFRDWIPYILLVLVYDLVFPLLEVVQPKLADPVLMDMDRTIFRAEPTLLMEGLVTPPLTDLMAFVYLMYFFLPSLIVLVFYSNGWKRDFRWMTNALIISFLIAFVGYMLVPTIGPKYYIPGSYSEPLRGIFLYGPISEGFETWRSTTRDCFPSHHTAMAVICIYFGLRLAQRYKAKWAIGAVCLFIGTCLIISTLYLRYHWGVDVIAGAATGAASIWLARYLARWSLANGSPSDQRKESSAGN